MKRTRVEQGDSIAKLADEHGFFPGTLWDHPENAELKALRKDMNVLAPGDVVTIPDLRTNEVTCVTGKRHRFRRRGVPMLFRAQILDHNTPRAGQRYELEVDGIVYKGETDADGKIEIYLPNRSRRGRLRVNEGDIDQEVLFGEMDPVAERSGIQKRLANLGFECGATDGSDGPRLRSALRAFQALAGLEPTGDADDATRAALVDCHDNPDKLAALGRAARAPGGAG